MNTHPMRLLGTAALVAAALVMSACASGTAANPTAPTARRTDPAGPSAASRLVCSDEAVEEIQGALGVGTVAPPRAAWADHLYSCPYRYSSGTMLVSVKELPDAAMTRAYFTAAQQAADSPVVLHGMGDAAFAATDGSVFVRKDLTVLHIDVHALPARFGSPVRTRSQVGRTVATTILICWKES